MTDAVAKLVTTKPDAEVAAELKKELHDAYLPVMAVIDKIAAAGFEGHVGSGMGPLGRQVITVLQVRKVY